MAHIYCSILFVLFLIFVAPITNTEAGFSSGDVPLWPIWDLKDPKVVFVAKCAVAEYNKRTEATLLFVNVVEGTYSSSDEGEIKLEYVVHLVISAKYKNGVGLRKYDTSILYRPWLKKNSVEMHHFAIIDQDEEMDHGSMEPIENLKDSRVMFAAKFAVEQYNKKSNTTLHFVSIVKGKRYIAGEGELYYLVISAKESNTTSNPINYEAVVWERLWLKNDTYTLEAFKQLSKLDWV